MNEQVMHTLKKLNNWPICLTLSIRRGGKLGLKMPNQVFF